MQEYESLNVIFALMILSLSHFCRVRRGRVADGYYTEARQAWDSSGCVAMDI